MVSDEPVSGQVKAHVMLTCTNGVSPGLNRCTQVPAVADGPALRAASRERIVLHTGVDAQCDKLHQSCPWVHFV